MQTWQQTFVDERGGTDGQNFDAFVEETRHAHEGTNPTTQAYRTVRTERAIILGATVFEALSQDALNGSGSEDSAHGTYEGLITDDVRTVLDQMPPSFADLALRYASAFQLRMRQEAGTQPPSIHDTTYGFYEAAHAALIDSYWETRIASNTFEPCDRERLKREWEQSRDFDFDILSLVADNVAGSFDLSVAMGMSLFRAKGRVCSGEELSRYFADNLETAASLASVNRNKLINPPIVLPYHFGYRVISGDAELAKSHYIHAEELGSGYKARWCHRSLQESDWPSPGHCPGSNYNGLRPRTEAELTSIQTSLAFVGLGRLVEGGTITSGQLMLSDAFKIAQTSLYQGGEWQEQVLMEQNQ
jgi:hypothetical protein